MDEFFNVILSRRSIRKFEDKDIPMEEIEECIRVATSAPSACNSQCWRFVVIKDRGFIKQIEDAVVKKYNEILCIKKDELSEEYLRSRMKMSTFFCKSACSNSNFYD